MVIEAVMIKKDSQLASQKMSMSERANKWVSEGTSVHASEQASINPDVLKWSSLGHRSLWM